MQKYFLLFFLFFLLPHCGKECVVKKRKLGVDYYKMSLLELEGDYVGKGSIRRALGYINQALEQRVEPWYLAHKATLLFLLGLQEESVGCFKRVLTLSMSASVRLEILNNYACLLAKGGRKEEALKLFKQLECDKDYLTPEVAMVNQAKLYCDDGEWHLARGKLECATLCAPDYVDAFYYLGLVCYALHEYDASLRSIERVIELESAHRGANELLSRLKRRPLV